VVQGLANRGIIFLASQSGHLLYGFAYNISDAAWDYINAHRNCLASYPLGIGIGGPSVCGERS